MHELLKHVLTERDLTRAGDLFAIPDSEIVDDLNEVLKQITDISSRADYCRNDRDQALIEICVTRVTSCIKETGTLDKYCGALVALLESCLHHNLMPLGHLRDDDPPHAKIASDIIACIVLVSFPLQQDAESHGNKNVMELFLPVAVQFLHKGNREISRHMARYLSLAAVHHAILLKPHVQTIMDSIMSGNYPLCRILSNLYEVSPEPIEAHAAALVTLIPHAEQVERKAVLSLLEQMCSCSSGVGAGGASAEFLRSAVSALGALLCTGAGVAGPGGGEAACSCLEVLQVLRSAARARPLCACGVRGHVARAARVAHRTHRHVVLAADILTHIGYTGRERAQEALNFIVEQLSTPERGSQGAQSGVGVQSAGAQGAQTVQSSQAAQAALVRHATSLCSAFPALFTDKLLTAVRAHHSNRPKSAISPSEVNRTSGGVTIVKLGGAAPAPPAPAAAPPPSAPPNTTATGGYTRRAKLGDSRSTGRLHPGPNPHKSMTRLNVAGGSVGGLHKSMTRLSSSQQINSQQNSTNTGNLTNGKPSSSSGVSSGVSSGASSSTASGATSGSASGAPGPRPERHRSNARAHHHHNILIGPALNNNSGPTIISGPSPLQTQSISVNPLTSGKSADAITPITSSVSIQHSNTALGHVSVITSTANSGPAILSQTCGSGPPSVGPNGNPVSISGPVTVTSRRANNTSVTMINSSNNDANSNHRISVFEPYPMRDTVQHFCEKHLDKIKAYMDNVSLRLPPPAKCTIEERRSKKVARLQFACGRRGPHCLYARAPFSLRTRAPRVWIHLMFLALQARHAAALSSRDPTVASLKHCWDILKCENKTFLTLVTGAFPGIKEQEMLLSELRLAGFFDVFELSISGAALPPTHATWGCFLCTHPERARGFLAADGQPVIEGQLKEKKGRWRLFRRWRTRYFTLSGAHLSCKGSSGGESIDINQIRSVKVSRGARNIPKAFEIFTGDQTLILKPKDGKNAEEWVQCLSIALAHSQARDAPAKANSLPARGVTLKSF